MPIIIPMIIPMQYQFKESSLNMRYWPFLSSYHTHIITILQDRIKTLGGLRFQCPREVMFLFDDKPCLSLHREH